MVGTENWILTEIYERRLEAVETDATRRSLRISRSDRIRNDNQGNEVDGTEVDMVWTPTTYVRARHTTGVTEQNVESGQDPKLIGNKALYKLWVIEIFKKWIGKRDKDGGKASEDIGTRSRPV